MRFQILKLIVWPKINSFTPRIIKFKLGKVNVITGASRTGKSAIIPILDYCLASSDCFIPIDTIRDHASWYGIVVQTTAEEILLARRVPDGTKTSNDFYTLRGEKVSIPPIIEEANQKTSDVKFLLNTIATTPFFSLGEEDDQNFKSRLSFRDLMALVFQSQEIVANQNVLFYKTHAHEHRERLRNWFPYILGAENIEVLKARQRLKVIEMQLKRLRRELEQVCIVSEGWIADMQARLRIASEYGLVKNDLLENSNPDHLLEIATLIVEDNADQINSNSSLIEASNEHMLNLEKEEAELSTSIGLSKKRLADIERLRSTFVDYGGGVKKRIERLHISRWLREVASESGACVFCGSSEHSTASEETNKICDILKVYEEKSRNMAEIPTSFDREEELIKSELNKQLTAKKALQHKFDLLVSKDEKAQKIFQTKKEMHIFIGHLKASLEIFKKLSDGGELKNEIQVLEAEQKELQIKANSNKVQKLLDLAIHEITQKILGHLKTLDVENKYRKIPPRFSVKNLNLEVLSDDGNWHFLAEVGSASNWVSFHLSLMCALQEYFISQKNSIVPSFVVFDQPSQVYFPKVATNADKDDDPKYDNEDVNAVQSMFETLSNSVKASNGEWQAIVLDHADDSVYGTIDGIHEVDVWRNGEKLIPVEWYKDSSSGIE